MMLLCVASFLISLRVIDIDIHDSFLVLFINKSKTDQYRQSNL